MQPQPDLVLHRRAAEQAERNAEALNARYAGASAQDILKAALADHPGRIALVSSFGAEAAVLLHLAARIDRDLPVLMLETGMLFPETLQYQRDLSAHLGLRDVRLIRPEPGVPDDLQQRDTLACCHARKVLPLERALAPFAASITGRKRYQTGQRAAMEIFEVDGAGRLRVNPLAEWTPEDLQAHMFAHELPRHPLVARGYPSIGCAPCTAPATTSDPRAGRWPGESREECGIHFTPDGKVRRTA